MYTWFVLLEATPADSEINRALSKPTSQVDGTNHVYAVDGKLDPTGTCTLTGSHDHPWMAIDLEQSYKVLRIALLNGVAGGEYKCKEFVSNGRAI